MDFQEASYSAVIGRLRDGMEKFGVRWNTVTCFACPAMTGIDWMAEDPVPMTATVLPVKSTPSCGQWPVWYVWPLKLSAPGKSGRRAVDRQPVAMTQYRADTASPRSVRTAQRCAAVSKTAS